MPRPNVKRLAEEAALNIKLCEGHIGGFGLVKIMQPNVTYRGVPIAKLVVVKVEQSDCVQCKANAKNRRTQPEQTSR